MVTAWEQWCSSTDGATVPNLTGKYRAKDRTLSVFEGEEEIMMIIGPAWPLPQGS